MAAMEDIRHFMEAAVKLGGYALCYAPESCMTDRAFVLSTVKSNGHALCYANDLMKADHEIVLVALQQTRKALQYAHPSLKAKHDFLLAAVNVNVEVLLELNGTVHDEHFFHEAANLRWDAFKFSANCPRRPGPVQCRLLIEFATRLPRELCEHIASFTLVRKP